MAITETSVRKYLLDAIRASPEAQEYFSKNLTNEDLLQVLVSIALVDSSEATRLQACYWASQFPSELLQLYEESLLKLQAESWESLSDHAVVALSKIHSKKGLLYLIDERIAPKLAWEADVLRCHLDDFLGA